MARAIRWPVTFLVLLVTWVFFRSENLEVALRYLGAMFGVGSGEVGPAAELLAAVVLRPAHLAQLAVALGIALFFPNTWEFLHRIPFWKMILGILLLFVSARVLSVQGFNPFLYFQF